MEFDRWPGKNGKILAHSGPCKRALVQLLHAVGAAKPPSLFDETYGNEQGQLTADDITKSYKDGV